MGKISIYVQDDIHAEKLFEFLSKDPFVLDAYINSKYYQQAVDMGGEHIHSDVVSVSSRDEDKFHIEIIVKNGSSRNYNFPEKKRKS